VVDSQFTEDSGRRISVSNSGGFYVSVVKGALGQDMTSPSTSRQPFRPWKLD
jgi:hypothetical protein